MFYKHIFKLLLQERDYRWLKKERTYIKIIINNTNKKSDLTLRNVWNTFGYVTACPKILINFACFQNGSPVQEKLIELIKYFVILSIIKLILY